MAKISVTYRAPKDDSKVVEMGGHTFFDGKVEKVDSDAEARFLGKLRNNPFFEVSDKDLPKADAAAAPKPVAPAPREAQTILIATEQADGTFAVMSGTTVVKVLPTKEDADAFNALSDEDKAEYVK